MPVQAPNDMLSLGAGASAAELLRGCLRLSSQDRGWQRPWRFTEAQVRAVGSCQAWHPGLLRQMARCAAGMRLAFQTDATRVEISLRLDDLPPGSRLVLARGGRADADPYELSADIDGRHVADLSCQGDMLALDLDDPAAHGMQTALPGMGENHRVCVWLPATRGCLVRDVKGNGSYLRPEPEAPQLLVLGDSIAQGFVTGDSALAWPSLLAQALSLDLVNQGLGGQVFQPGTLLGLPAAIRPELIVVALGENYRYEPCRANTVARDVRAYLSELTRLWPHVPTLVCTPTWHDETASHSHALSCWREVPGIIEAACAAHAQMTLVDGRDLMDSDPSLLADDDGHPNAEGARQIAERLALVASGGAEDEGAGEPSED